MAFPLNDLGQALTSQIYQTVMGGDGKVPPPKDTFFSVHSRGWLSWGGAEAAVAGQQTYVA